MMKKTAACVVLVLLVLSSGCVRKQMKNTAPAGAGTASYEVTMKRDLLCLIMSYKDFIVDVRRSTDGNVYVIMKSGKPILYDDKKNKNYQQKLVVADLQDMMEQVYPLDDIKRLMEGDFDPGRIRSYALLKEVYGGAKSQVQPNLVPVKAGYKSYLFNHSNNAAAALHNVMGELVPLTKYRQDIRSFVFPSSGTFNYRVIAGTSLLSPHSFGIAIDLARDNRDYWKWTSRKEGEKRLLVYPREIVRIFEKNNFIWGGKWAHFDILHFEYRPELILKSRFFPQNPQPGEPWYEGAPCENVDVKRYIELIDKALE